MSDKQADYIVVEGPIGVGKTSLAQRLATSFNTELLLEAVEDNPFLERFYRDPRQAALSTQLSFLLKRAQQVNDLRQSDLFRSVRIADFLIEKDRLFAELTLDNDEMQLYQQVYSHLTVNAPKPDLVIYLQAPVEVLLTRIARRGRTYEQRMEAAYLQGVCDAYARFFYDYHDSPLLIVNASDINLIDNADDYLQLLNQIRTIRSGRHYFNPLSLSL